MNARKRITRSNSDDKHKTPIKKTTRQKKLEENCIRQVTFATRYGITASSVSQRVQNGTLDCQIIGATPHIDMTGPNTLEVIRKLENEGPGKQKNNAPKMRGVSGELSDEAKEIIDLKAAKEKLEVRKLQITCDEKEGILIPRDYVKVNVFSYLQALHVNILNMPSDIELEYRTALKEGASTGTLKKILTTPLEEAIEDAIKEIKKALK